MPKKGLPTGIAMRHDSHYVEELVRTNRPIGRIIPINQIEPNPDQPRVEIGDLTELVNSIKEKGVLEPLLVRPNSESRTWMIIAGERRWRAANLAGLVEVPCIELDIDDNSVAEIALIENLQRKDLTLWEEADGFASLAKRFGYTHDDIAKKIGKSRSTITESMTIAGIPAHIRERCIEAKIASKSTLLELARQFDEQAMQELLDNIQNKSLSRQEIRQTVRPQTPKIPAGISTGDHTGSGSGTSGSSISGNSTSGNSISDNSISDNSTSISSKEPSKTKPSSTKPSGSNSSRVFSYISRSKGFSVEVKFNDNNSYTNQDIIEALEDTLKTIR